MKTNTKNLTSAGLLTAAAYIVMLMSKLIPEVAGFLQFDAKDVIIVIGGFILGPVYALMISITVSIIELVTVSNTGLIGMLMNIISTGAFSYTAALIYSKKRSFGGAITSLVFGTLTLTVIMLMWNYFITPVYMKVPREVVASMLPTVFLPFNLLKGAINSGLTLVLYKPLSRGLSRAGVVGLCTPSNTRKAPVSSVVIGIIILVICIPIFMHLIGII